MSAVVAQMGDLKLRMGLPAGGPVPPVVLKAGVAHQLVPDRLHPDDGLPAGLVFTTGPEAWVA